MSKTLTEVAQQLKDADKKVRLVYAFNGTGKTRLSRSFKEVVCSILEQTTAHGAIAGKTQTSKVKYYNLDAVISVGYRVNSSQATQFRIWATALIKAYIIKGFAMDDVRLKNGRFLAKTISANAKKDAEE